MRVSEWWRVEVERKVATIGAFVGGRARDFVLRASPKIVTVNTAGARFDSSVVRPLRKGKVWQGTAGYYSVRRIQLCLCKTQPQQPTRARTRAVGFVPR